MDFVAALNALSSVLNVQMFIIVPFAPQKKLIMMDFVNMNALLIINKSIVTLMIFMFNIVMLMLIKQNKKSNSH